MSKELEDYLTEPEKKLMRILEENYRKTGNKWLYQSAQQLLQIAETRRCKKRFKG